MWQEDECDLCLFAAIKAKTRTTAEEGRTAPNDYHRVTLLGYDVQRRVGESHGNIKSLRLISCHRTILNPCPIAQPPAPPLEE